MKSYRIKNIDCASCAAKIEQELLKIQGVTNVNINFVTSILNIDFENIDKIRETIKSVEPDVIVEELTSEKKYTDNDLLGIKKEILKICIVLFIFLFGIIFKDDFHNSPLHFAEFLIFISAYLISGYGVLKKAAVNITKGKFFDENFLMSVATLGAIAIHELPEAVAVMLFYNVGEFIQGLAVKRSRKSIKSLLEIRPDYANIKVKDTIVRISPEDVRTGEIIIVKPGERIPLDGEVIEGNSFVDTFALTGEPVPKSVRVKSNVLAGMINKSGLLIIKVTKVFGESSISKILELVQNAGHKKAETEKFISKFARFYTPIVVAIAIMIALLPPLFVTGYTFEDWIYRALVILVISCPCALVISIPLGYFGGIGGASRNGILVKGSNYLDALTEVKTVVFDKTGTLTKGVFKVTDIVTFDSLSKDELLKFAAIAEAQSNHPIADSIKEAYGKEINLDQLKRYEEVSGQGIKADINGSSIIAGNDRILHSENIEHPICNVEGTVVHVAVNRNYAGYIVISDELKEDAVKAINSLKKIGIKRCIMFTGDNNYSAKAFAKKLNMDSFYAELLPEDKVNYMEKILNDYGKEGKVAFVGDGINDAPVITRADVGIAMGGLGSDAAVEASDIVIMKDHPSKVAEAVSIAKETRKIVWQNIFFALGIKAFFIALGGLGIASMWEAVFADIGVALLAILNSARILKINRENF